VRITSCVVVLGILVASGLGAVGQTGNGTVYPPDTGSLYTDVPSEHWAYDDLKYLTERGILTGIAGGQYLGEQAMDRYTGAALVARAMRYLQSNPSSVTMDDLNAVRDLIFGLSEEVRALGNGNSPTGIDGELQRRVEGNEREISALRSDVDGLLAAPGGDASARANLALGVGLGSLVFSLIALVVAFLS